jgi:thermitase
MLSLLYPICYLLSLTGLILWFYFKDNRAMSRKMSSLFLISFLIYLFSLAFTEASLAYKLLMLCRDLVILGVVSQFFNFMRQRPVLVLLAGVALYALIQFVGFTMLYNTFPEVNDSATASNDDFELLVETRNGEIPKAYDRLIKKYNLAIEPAFRPDDPSLSRLDEFLVVGIPDQSEGETREIIRELKRLSGTQHVEYNEVVQLEIIEDSPGTTSVKATHVNDPMVNRQWGWDAIQGDRVHDMLAGSGLKPQKRVLLAIIDSGVDALHEDLTGQFQSNGASNDTDPLGHGTHCAGIAAAISNNGVGIASLVPDASYIKVTSVKVMNASGIGNQQTIIQGIIKAADMGADVISLSLGSISSDSRQRAYDEAVRYANAKGAIVIAAAGNSNQNAKGYSPANAKGIISVAALGPDQKKAPFSNTVKDLSFGVAAPGMKVLSTYPNGQYKEMDGTSMATPMVAGLVAMLKAFRPDITTQEVYNILQETGKNLPDGRSTGRMIQAADALERVLD